VCPVRDPDDRSVRRMAKDVVRERARPDGAPAAARPTAGGGADSAERPRSEAGNWLEDEFEQLPTRQRHGGRRSEVVRRRVGRLRAGDEPGLPCAPRTIEPEPAAIVALTRGQCEVETGDGELVVAHLPKALALHQQTEIAVGDRVLLERRSSGALAVAQLLPRTSRLSRPDPFYAHRERVLAANLDLAVVVASVRKPPFVAGIVDRFLVALAHGGVPAVLVVNKVDLIPEPRAADAEISALAPYLELDLTVVPCSTRSGEGIDRLRDLLAGRTAAFVGHSGVGKTSLLNVLAPGLEAEVGDVSGGNRRGRHTTTRARIYRIGDGARVVDTPGLREFGLWRMTARELAAYFDEFGELAARCRFANCTHDHEPRCAVRAAAERGDLPRYATYRRILDSLDRS
jgi:ribosome biogenesis GTPase / thiamine phosphate phosphatase